MFGGAGRFDDEPGGFGSARSAGGRDDATKDVEEVASRLSTFRQLLGKIGSPSDSKQLRDEVARTQSAFAQSVRVAKNKLQPQIKSSDQTTKVQADRLWQQLQQSLGAFENLLKELRNKETRFPASGLGGGVSEEIVGFGDSKGMPPPTSSRAAQAQELDTINLEKRQEDHRQLMNLERDMQDLHEMFVDMAAMVNDQGETLNSIEGNVESAQMKTEQAVTHTRKAAEYQSKSRRKKICVVILILIILAVIITVIAVLAN